MPAFWKLNWLRSLVSGNRISKLPLRTKRRSRHLALETLEERVTPASFRYDAVDAAPLTLWLDSGRLQVVDTDDLSVLADYALGDVDDLTIGGNGFDVTLTLDSSVPTVPGGILFESGTGATTLLGPVTDTTWNINGVDAGYVNSPGYFSFTGVENLTGADNNQDTFIFTAGGSISGTVDGGAGGTDTIIGGSGVNALNMEMAPDVTIGTADVVIDLSKYQATGVVRLDPDKVRVFRPSPGMITVESQDGGFTSQTFADPTNSLTIKTGFNAKGTDEHIYVEALGTFSADLILDTGSTNKNNDGPDTIELRGNVNLVGHDLEATAETIDVESGVIISTSNPTQAGAITFTGWDITLDANAQLLAEGATKATSGAIVIDAVDNNAYFTPFANVDISDVSITVKTGAIIRGGDVTMQARADNQHILSLDEFTDSSSAAKIGLVLTDIIAQAIEGITQIGAGVSYSEATAKIDIQANTEIDAQNLYAYSLANASAITAPITFLVGPALGICLTDATVTVAGTVTTTGNATFQTGTDHAVNVFSDTSGLAGAAAALAVSVISSNATAQVTDDANLTIGGDLTVVSSTIDRNRTAARSNANADGSVGIAITVAIEVGDTNAYLDGVADVAGNVVVGASQQKLPVPNSKLFVVPNWANGVSAQAGVGENTTGDFLDDQKAAAIGKVTGPIKTWAIGKYNQWKGKKAEVGDNAPPLPVSVAAAIAVAVDTNNVSSRIGDGDSDGDNKNGNVEADGTIDVTSTINNRPDITASASAKFDSSAQPSNDSQANQNNKFAGAFAFGVGIYGNNASSIINEKAEVDAKQKLTVKAEALNDYEFTYGVNLITPFLEEPAYTTDDGTQTINDGDIVEVKEDFAGQGHVGNWYLYHGPTRTINLGAENYLNTASWLDQGGRIGKTAKGFIGNLTNYLNDNFGLDNNAVDSWSQAVAGGDTDVAVAGSIMFVQMHHTVDALIKDSAKINQDTSLRTTTQDVAVEATSANDAVNFGGNIQLPGLTGSNTSFKINVNKPGAGSGTNNGKGAVGFTFQMYDYANQVTAKIEDDVELHATSLEVDAETRGMSIVVGASGGKSNGVAFNGAFAVNLIDNDTIAQIDNGALIDVGAGSVADADAGGAAVFVDATDTTYAIIIVGGVAVSDHVGIGATVGINVVDRESEAIIGNGADDASNDTRQTFTAGGNVKLNAKNDGFIGAFAVSGSSTSSNSNTAPQGPTGMSKNDGSGSVDDPGKLPNNQSNYDSVIKELKMKFGESDSQASDANSAGNNKGKAGISISGAVSVSVVDDDARAYVRNTGAFTVNDGQLIISANNNTSIGSLAGAVAIALGGGSGNNLQLGIAGAVGIDLMGGTTDAFVDGPSSITADGVTLGATRTGYIVSLTAGVSGAVGRQGIAIGGSVAVMRTVNTTETGLRNTTGTINGPITAHANDDSTIILIAGSGGFGGQAGVGAAVAFSEIQNTVRSEIENVEGDALLLIPNFKHTGAIDLQAIADGAIIAIAGSAGVGTQGSSGGGAGTIAINFIDNTVEAQILNTTTTNDSTGDITLRAEDDSLIVSIAGAVGVGQTGAVGAALGFNFITNDLKAVIENSNLTTDGAVSLTADSDATIGGVAVGVAVGTGSGFALEGSVEVNTIVNTIDAHITGSTVNADGAVTIRVVDQALLISIAGGVAATVSGSAGVGASISYNRISNGVAAYIDDSTVDSNNSFISLSAGSTPLLVAIGAAGGGGQSIGGAGTLTINSIANTIDAHITGSDIEALGDVSVTASESASMVVVALAGAGAATGSAIGASIAYNYVGGPEPADPNVLSYNDGVVDGTKNVTVAGSEGAPTSSVQAFIDGSNVSAGGDVIVLAGFADPTAQADPGPIAAEVKTVDPTTQVNTTTSTITFSSPHGYKTGDEVVYYKGAAGNVSLGGLVDGRVYFIIKVDDNTIKLADTQTDAVEEISIDITSTGTGTGHSIRALDLAGRQPFNPKSSNTSNNQIKFVDDDNTDFDHGFTTGEPVVYHKGGPDNTAIGGLVDGQVYYVIRDAKNKFRLALTPTSAGLGLAVPLISAGSGEGHSFTPLAAAKTFTPATAAVVHDSQQDEITFSAPHGLETGDAVFYRPGSGSPISGLRENETYYVIKIDATRIRLAATHNDAVAEDDDGNPAPRHVFLTSKGTGTAHSLIVKPRSATVMGVSAALPIGIGGQITSVTAAGAGGQGLAGAGAVSLNFVRMDVLARISNVTGADQVSAGGDVRVQAIDTSHINSGAGSLGISTGSGVAINASVGVNDIRNNVQATIEGATVQAPSGDVTVSAAERARIINVVVGGAAAVGGGLAFGGSFAINFIKNTVDAGIRANSSGASDVDADGNIAVTARDTASIATLAGNVSFTIGGTGAVGVAFAVNEVNDSVTATIDGSTANAATGDITVDATFAKPNDLPAGLDVQIAAMAVAGGGASTIAGAGSVALNWVRNTVQAKIANVGNLGTGDELSAGGDISVTASDNSTINSLAGAVAIAGIGASGASGAIGASVAYNYLGGDPNDPNSTDNNVVRAAIENVAGSIRADSIDVHASYVGSINNITVAGAGAGTFALGGAVSINFIRNTADAHISNAADVVSTATGAQSIRVRAEDDAAIWVLAGGVGIAIATTTPVGLAAGVSVAVNEITNNVTAYVDNSLVTAGGSIEISAESESDIQAITIGVAIAVSAGTGGFSGSGAGAGSGNTIQNTIHAYIANSQSAANKGVFANGSLVVSAVDNPTIIAGAGALAFSGSFGGGGGAGVSIGASVTENTIDNSVKAYVDNATARATGGNLEVTATETANIDAYSVAGSVAITGGSLAAASGAGAGGSATNTVSNTVEAYVLSGSLTTLTSGDVRVTATDSADVNAVNVAGAVAIAASGVVAGAIAIGASIANNDIENTVRAYSQSSTISSADSIVVTAGSTAIINAVSVAVSISAAVSPASLALSGAGAESTNTVNNTIAAFIQGQSAAARSTTTAADNITVSATENATITSKVVAIAGSGGIAGGSVGVSIADNTVTSGITAYAQNANLTATNNNVSISASATDTVDTLSVATSIAIAIGGAGAGGEASADVSPTVEAYAGSATTLSAGDNVTVAATSNNSVDAESAGAAGGLVAIGSSITDAKANGSVKAHIDGAVSGSDNLTVTATATNTADSLAIALAGGIVAGAGARADSTVSPTVEAYTGNANITARQAMMVTATATPHAITKSVGVAVSAGVSVGAALAYSTVSPAVSAYVGGAGSTINAASLSIIASQFLPGGSDETAEAHAIGAAGGVLAGISGSEAKAFNGTSDDQATYRAYIADGAALTITGSTAVSVNSNSKQNALSDNYNLGLLAAGAGGSYARSNTINEAYLGNNVSLTGHSLNVSATGIDNNFAEVRAGSGGAVAGAGAKADTDTVSSTKARIRSGDGVKKIDLTGGTTGTLQIAADHTAAPNARVLVLAGGLLAGTGAESFHTVNSTVESSIGSSAIVWAKDINLTATNHVSKPALPDYENALDSNKTGPNILGATGGLASASGAASSLTITFDTQVKIGQNASVEVKGNPASPGGFVLAALNDIQASDKVTLGTGGAISGAGASSRITTDGDLAKVDIGDDADLKSLGGITMSARGQGTIFAGVAVDTFGVGTVAVAESEADIRPVNEIHIGDDATVHADGDLRISTGTDTDFNRDQYTIEARTDTFAGSLIPISAVDAQAKLTQTNTITVDNGAVVETARNAYLHAERNGFANMTAYAKATSWVSAIGDAINGQSFDEGEVNTAAHAKVQMDGTIRTGIAREKRLILDSWNSHPVSGPPTVSASTNIGTVTYNVTQEPLQSSLLQELANAQHQLDVFGDSGNTTLINFYTNEVNRLTALLQEQGLLDQPTSPNGTPPAQANNVFVMTVTLDDIWAQAGIIDVRTDVLLGDGLFDSPGDAKVIIHNSTPAFLRVKRVTIPQTNGGVFFNGNAVSSATVDDFNVFEDGLPVMLPSFQPFALPGTGIPPVVEIKNTFNPLTYSDPNFPNDVYPPPDITVIGSFEDTILRGIDNLSGNVSLVIEGGKGNININAPVRAKNLSVITGGDVNISGVTDFSIGGEALSHWKSVSDLKAEDDGTGAQNLLVQAAINALLALPLGANSSVQIATINQGVQPASNVVNGVPTGIRHAQAVSLPYATGGTFTLTFNGQTTAPVPYNVTAPALQTLLNNLPTTVAFSVSGDGSRGNPFIVQVTNTFDSYPQMTANVTNLIGNVALYGDRITIDAEYLNINGIMQSGKPDYVLNIGAATAAEITTIKNAGVPGLHVLKTASTPDFVVRYDYGMDRIQIEEVQVSGGYIEIHGHVINTGKGEIRLLGGYGNITIDNTTAYDVVIKRLDASQSGAGKLIIQDDAKGPAYITLYEKAGNTVTRTIDSGSGPQVATVTDNEIYTPQSGYRYGWSISQEQYTRKYETTASSTWLGIDALAADPASINWDSIEQIGQPVLVGEGPYYISPSQATAQSLSGNYTWHHNVVNITAPRYYTINEHTETSWYGKKTYYATLVEETKNADIYTHTIRADRDINIKFLGYSEATVSVTSAAGILLDGPILNTSGVTTLTAAQEIEELRDGATVGGRRVVLSAGTGIGNLGDVETNVGDTAPSDFSSIEVLVGVGAGDRVKLAAGYANGGTPGAIYRYLGQTAVNLNLGAENYADTSKWQLATGTAFKYTTDANKTRIVPGNQVLVSAGHTAGGVVGSVYRYKGTSPALLDLSNQNFASAALWETVQFFASFKATTTSGIIDVSQLAGDLPIDIVSAGPGADINLTAAGDIRVAQLGASTWATGAIGNTIQAGTVNLTATSGGIGAAGRLITIYSGTLNKDTVSLTAQNSIYVKEGVFSAAVKASNPRAGDLRLKKAIAASPTGVIHIEVPDGALIDANNSQVVDERTTEQLATGIWRDLGLTNETPILPGDTVQVAAGHTAGGTPGAVYRYVGDAATLLLGDQDYTDANLWELTGETFGKYSTEPGAGSKVNDTIDSFIGQKNAEYKAYWNFRTQQAHDDAIGLADDQVYYVVVDPTNPNRIMLALTHADAVAGTNLIDISVSPTLGADHSFQFVPAANLDDVGQVTGTGPLLGFDSKDDVFGDIDAILLGAHGLQTGDAVLYTRSFNFAFDEHYHVRLSDAEEAFYRNELGFDDAAILTLENQRTAQYIELHARYGQFGDTFDPNFNYVPTQAEDEFLRGSIRVWTVEELLNTISAGLLKPSAGTQTQIEDPNIQGHDVTIIAAKTIGQNGGQITLDLVNRPKPLQLTTEERIAFAAADRIDVSYIAGAAVTAFVDFANSGDADTITRIDGGSWLSDGLTAGMYIEVAANSANATAKGVAYQIASVTDTVITLTGTASLQNDVAKTATLQPVVLDPRTPTARIIADFADAGSADTITRTDGGDWLDDGFQPGMQIQVAGTSANATGVGQFYTIAGVTATVITLTSSASLVDEEDVQVTVTGPTPTVTAIVIDQRDDVNVNATGVINATAGTNLYLGSGAPEGGSETSLNLGQIVAGDDVRIKSRPGIFNAAAAGIVNILGGDLILESGNNAVGTAAAPIFIELQPGATLTARAALDVYVSQHNAASTAGDMNVETVSSDTGGVYLVADGSIVDALGTDTPKIGASHINLAAGGGIGESTDALEINLTPAGTLHAVAQDDIRIRETSGSLNIELVQSNQGDVWLRAAGSILDANATGAVDIYANNLTLTSDFSAIGLPGNDLDIDTRFGGAQDGVLTSTSVLDANIIEVAGDLYLFEVRTDFPDIDATVYTAFIAASQGSILNGNPTGHNVLSGRTLLFARDDIGAVDNHLTTLVGILQGTSTLGDTWVDNTGELQLDAIDGGSPTSVQAGGSVYINASSPVTISQNIIAGDEVVIVAHDDALDGNDPQNDDVPDHLIVESGVIVTSGEFVRLLAGDDLTIEVGAIIGATEFIDLFGDFQGDIDGNPAPVGQPNADPGVGSTITILGTLNAPQITIQGEADRDTILIDMSAQGSSITGHVDVLGGSGDDIVVITNLNTRADAMDVDGQEGADTYVVNIRGSATGNLINVFDSGTDAGADQVQEPFGAVDGAADTILVTEGVFRTGQAVMYHGDGTSDGVLVEGRLYFVVVDPNDPTKIQLATTYADATAPTPVVIDVSGVTGSGHSLSAIDDLAVYGTDVADTFLLRASKHEFVDGGSAFVAAVYGDPAASVERVSYNKNLENLILDTKGGDDTIAIDDNWTTTTVFSGEGEDKFQIGQIFKSERDAASAGIAPDDEFETVAATRGFLSNGVSYTANLNGGADADTFTVFRNVAEVGLFGDDGDDNFVIRAFALEGSQTSTVAGQGGADFVQYVLNAPVDIVGGDGTDTARLIGTEFGDRIVVTAAAIHGAGVSVTYSEVEILEIDAAEGNDTFYVLSTDPGVETILYGGLGSDTFNVGGDVPEILDSANNVLFPATAGNHTMAGIATSLLTLNGESSPGFILTLVAPVMLPGETNALPPMGDVVSHTGTGGPLAIDTMTINDTNLAGVGIVNPLITPITDPGTQLVGKTIEISTGPGRGRFWLIQAAVQGPLAGQWTLTLKNVAQPDDAWGIPDGTSTFAITHASPAFFTDETLSVDYATIFNDAAPGQTGVLAPLDTEIIGGHVIVTSTMLTGLGMTTGIKSTQLENLDILLGDGDDEFTVRATAQNTATLIQANGGADLVNVGSTAADNDGNLDLIQGRLTVLGGANPVGPPEDRIYVSDYASTGRMNYLITPSMVVHFDLPDSWLPSPPIANYDPPRPTFAGMDYDGTTEFLHMVGNDEVNIFNVQPSLDTEFHIDGRLPPSGVPLPGGGDYLHLDTHTTGTTGRRLHITAIGTGHWGFTSAHHIVSFESIERFNHVATYAVASNGRTPNVKVYDAETNQLLYQVRAYEPFFRGGVRAVTGDVNHDGLPDLIVAPGAGRPPTVKVYSGTPNAAGNYPRPRLTQFNVFPKQYKKGVNVALGDINNDGALDLIVAADSGWVPEVKVFHGRHIVGSHKLLIKSFLVFPNSFRGGVRVAADDINRDGFADIVVGTGPGTVSSVRIFGGDRLMAGNRKPLRTIKPFGKTNKTGVFVSIGDFNGDGVRDVTASADRGWLPFVVTFNGSTAMAGPLQELARFQAFPNTTRTGVRVASKPTDGGNPGFVEAIDLFLSTGPQGGTNSRRVRLAEYRSPGLTPTVIDRLFAENSFDGIYLG